MNTSRREARRAEIDRDHRLVALGFLKNLQRLVDDQVARVLLDDAVWPDQVLEAVQAVLEAGAAEHRHLNDERINLRGHRGATFEDTAPLPEVLGAYRHRGNYHGAFATMGDAGRVLLLELELPEGWVDRGLGVMLAEMLHRRGELWTFERTPTAARTPFANSCGSASPAVLTPSHATTTRSATRMAAAPPRARTPWIPTARGRAGAHRAADRARVR
jgi:hypothetical protein